MSSSLSFISIEFIMKTSCYKWEECNAGRSWCQGNDFCYINRKIPSASHLHWVSSITLIRKATIQPVRELDSQQYICIIPERTGMYTTN